MRCLLLVAGLFSIAVARPTAAQPAIALTSGTFQERFSDRVLVSGRTLVGLMSAREGALPSDSGLFPASVALPGALVGNGAKLCVRAATQDGRYVAENTSAAREGRPGADRAGLS